MLRVRRFIFLLVTALPHGAGAYDVLINVTGNVILNSCSISSGSQNMTVELGNYATSRFSGKGGGAEAVPFYINIEGCTDDVVSKARVKFSGESDDTNSQLLALDGSSGSGVAIRLLDKDKQKMVLGEWGGTWYNVNGEEGRLLYYAQYEAVSDTISAGSGDATATFLVEFQ